MITFTYNSKKCKLIYNDGKQISGCWDTVGGGAGDKGTLSQLWGMMDIILTVVMALQVSTYVNRH